MMAPKMWRVVAPTNRLRLYSWTSRKRRQSLGQVAMNRLEHLQGPKNRAKKAPDAKKWVGVRAGFEIHLAHLGQTHPGGAQPAASFARSAHRGVAAQVAYRSPFWRTWTMDGHCGRKTNQEAPAPGWQFLAVVAGHSLEDEKAFRWVDGYDHIMTSCVLQTDRPDILEDAVMAIQQWPNEHAKLHQQQVRCYLIIMISSLSHR